MMQGILFDMDGVIFDTERLYNRMDIEVAKDMGYTIDFTLTSQFLGTTADHCRALLARTLGDGFDYDIFHKEVHRRAYAAMEQNGIAIKPGVLDLLDFLTENNYKRAVASSSGCSIIQHHLELAGLTSRFDTIVGGDMVSNSKPHPDIFLLAAKNLGLIPSQCLAIEDSFNGVRSACAAGCITVMVPDLLPPDEEMKKTAHFIMASLEEMPDFLTSFSGNIQ